MPTADTLRADSALVRAWSDNSDYDYLRDLVHNDESLIQVILSWIGDYLSRMKFAIQQNEAFTTALAIAFMLLFCVGIWFLWRHLARRRGRVRVEDVAYSVTEDSIYGIDFDAELAKAIGAGQSERIVRLLYLRTLRHLHDAGCLSWSITQTPQEFVAALKDDDLRTHFAHMTQSFVRVRYGHFPATAEDIGHMKAWAASVNEHIAHSAAGSKKGGEE